MNRREFIKTGFGLLGLGIFSCFAKQSASKETSKALSKDALPLEAVASPDVARVYYKSDMVLAEERCYSFSFQDDVDAENYWLEYSVDEGATWQLCRECWDFGKRAFRTPCVTPIRLRPIRVEDIHPRASKWEHDRAMRSLGNRRPLRFIGGAA